MAVLRVLEAVSLVTTIIGLYFIGEKDAIGFLVFDVSLCCQIYIFCKNKNWFLVCQMIVLILFNTYNYIKWVGGI